MEYTEFLKKKIKTSEPSEFEIDESQLNNSLFDFQKFIVLKALKSGKYALFDGLLRLPGESAGADAEVAMANKLNIPVYYSINDIAL